MLSIHSIPFEDIELFLSANDKTVPQNINEAYDMTLNIIEKNEYFFISDNLNEWLLAFNVQKSNTKIKTYNKTDILSYPINELCNLAELLKTDNLDQNHLINILNYLNKINDVHITTLPNDILLYIMKFTDLRSTMLFCETCKSIIKISKNISFKHFLVSKINNNLDMSKFTMKEILFCAKSLTAVTRNKMSIVDNILYIIDLSIIHEIDLYFNNSKTYSHNGVNKMIKYRGKCRPGLQWWSNSSVSTPKNLIIQLMNNGTIFIKDTLTKKEERFGHLDNIVNISTKMEERFDQINNHKYNQHYIETSYLTTNKGIIYQIKDFDIEKTDKISTTSIYNNIIGTISESAAAIATVYTLLTNGTVDIYDGKSSNKIPKINNIIRILLYKNVSKVKLIMLTELGEIYYYAHNCFTYKEVRLNNIKIIEIIFHGHKIYALDDNNVIWILTDNDAPLNKIKLTDIVDDIW